MADRWSTAEVLALAPDAGVVHAARALATPSAWSDLGCDDVGLWGLYRGTSAEPYEVIVDRTGPAWRCSCPSRKIPCKHGIGLLLLWAEGNVPLSVRPASASSWLAARATTPAATSGPDGTPAAEPFDGMEATTAGTATRAGRATRAGGPAGTGAPASPRDRRADERAARVRSGLAELDRWLADQVRRGLTAPDVSRHETWEAVAARLVDAQAPAVANRVRRATELLGAGDGWHERVLAEMANLHALAVAGARTASLDDDLAMSVRTAVGWTVAKEDVLAGAPTTDHWHVVARSDTEEHRILVRRTWLLGRATGRWALLLSFAAFGQGLDGYPPVGSVLHADVHYFPGRVPIRALIGVHHGPAVHDREGPVAATVDATLADAGWALAREPWLERWPGVVLAVPARASSGNGGRAPAGAAGDRRWVLLDDTGALPLVASAALPTLLAVSGGRPVVVAGEHRAGGFAPLAVRVHDRAAVLV